MEIHYNKSNVKVYNFSNTYYYKFQLVVVNNVKFIPLKRYMKQNHRFVK